MGVSMMPGQIVLTRTPITDRSRAAGTVMPTMPPLDAEYASWPVWPSRAATDAVLITTPRWPSPSAGSVLAIAAAPMRIRLNVPIRLTVMTFWYVARACGAPSRFTVRSAQPMPALLTITRSGAPESTAACTAAATSASADTSVLTKMPPISSAMALPLSSLRSAITTLLPCAARSRTVASPRPLAPPDTTAETPFRSIAAPYLSYRMLFGEVTHAPPTVGSRLLAAATAPRHGPPRRARNPVDARAGGGFGSCGRMHCHVGTSAPPTALWLRHGAVGSDRVRKADGANQFVVFAENAR